MMAVMAWASCVTRKYEPPGMAVQGQLYRDTTAAAVPTTDTSPADKVSIATLPYTQLFTDTVLQSLIAEGIRENPDLKTAVQRISEAQANFLQSRAAFLPSLYGIGSVTRSKQSIAALNLPPDFIGAYPLTTTAYAGSLSTSWEADTWGKLRSAKKAALANLLQSDAAKRAVQTRLVADIATYYYQLLSLDQQLIITTQTLENR